MPKPQGLAEPLLNANEAAQLLRIPRSTLYELVRSRGLPHIRVGRHLRFTRSASELGSPIIVMHDLHDATRRDRNEHALLMVTYVRCRDSHRRT
jgi:excisionase family DNA binding protein